jgi:hypothetical protein
MKTLDLGNNEEKSRGMAKMPSGEYLALTYSQSKTFKTEAGAIKWLAQKGLQPNGDRI